MKLIAFAAIGRLLVWTIQTSGPTQRIKTWLNTDFTNELWACDFCLGFWVFAGLAALFEINILEPYYFPIFSEIITGLVASFVVHLARIGWTAKWGYEVLE